VTLWLSIGVGWSPVLLNKHAQSLQLSWESQLMCCTGIQAIQTFTGSAVKNRIIIGSDVQKQTKSFSNLKSEREISIFFIPDQDDSSWTLPTELKSQSKLRHTIRSKSPGNKTNKQTNNAIKNQIWFYLAVLPELLAQLATTTTVITKVSGSVPGDSWSTCLGVPRSGCGLQQLQLSLKRSTGRGPLALYQVASN